MKRVKKIGKYFLQAVGVLLFLDFVISLERNCSWIVEHYEDKNFTELIEEFLEDYIGFLGMLFLYLIILSGVLGFAFYKMDKALEEFEIIDLRKKKQNSAFLFLKHYLQLLFFFQEVI